MSRFIGRYELIDEIARIEAAPFCKEERKEYLSTRYERYFDYSQAELEALASSLGMVQAV